MLGAVPLERRCGGRDACIAVCEEVGATARMAWRLLRLTVIVPAWRNAQQDTVFGRPVFECADGIEHGPSIFTNEGPTGLP
jgi:hypothetical protein